MRMPSSVARLFASAISSKFFFWSSVSVSQSHLERPVETGRAVLTSHRDARVRIAPAPLMPFIHHDLIPAGSGRKLGSVLEPLSTNRHQVFACSSPARGATADILDAVPRPLRRLWPVRPSDLFLRGVDVWRCLTCSRSARSLPLKSLLASNREESRPVNVYVYTSAAAIADEETLIERVALLGQDDQSAPYSSDKHLQFRRPPALDPGILQRRTGSEADRVTQDCWLGRGKECRL